MDVNLLLFQHMQYVIPMGVVLVGAILVFVFGFKKAEQPPFAQLSVGSDVDRKFANKKRSKIKEKRSANGQVSTEKASPLKKSVQTKPENTKKSASKVDDVDGKLKEQKQDDNKTTSSKKDKDQILTKAGKENKVEQAKNKKNLKNLFLEKPVDFDEGDWEQAYSRKDKKNKKKEEESPSKKNKKNVKKADLINEVVAKQKEPEKIEIKDKVAKETENNELKEKDKKDIVLIPITNEEIVKETEDQKKEELPKIEKVEKVEKAEKEEKKNGKSKKAKKVSESESAPAAIPKVDNKLQEQKTQKNEENTEKVSDNVEQKNSNVTETQEKTAVFNELEEVKPQKKSKKKARKDN